MERLWSLVFESGWRAYPAAALALLGLWLVARGLWFGSAERPGLLRQGRDAYAWIRGFQVGVAGLALVGVAAAWAWRQPRLLVLALGVLGEEMYETSRILTALKRGPRRAPTGRGTGREPATAG